MKGKLLKITLIIALALAIVIPSFGIVAAAPPDQTPGLQRAIEVKEQHANALLETPGVVAVGVGNNSDGNVSVIVFSETRGARGIPTFLDGVPVVLQYSGPFSASPKPDGKGKPPKNGDPVDPTTRFDRPVPIGVSTGHPNITAGTIGARVRDSNGNVYALSNNHVYANENLATIGDAVIQPGSYDGGSSPGDDIGTLRGFVRIEFSGDNYVDAALASTTTALLSNSTPSDGYGVPQSSTAPANIGLKVKKYGRTTGETNGRIYATNVTVDVAYDSGVARFVDQIVVTPGSFSAGGDSGSLIVLNNKRSANHLQPIGLLFAGSSQYTLANPIDSVLSAFGVTIDGS